MKRTFARKPRVVRKQAPESLVPKGEEGTIRKHKKEMAIKTGE